MLEQIDVHRISEPSIQEFFCFLPSQCVYQVCMPSFLEADRLERDVVALQYKTKKKNGCRRVDDAVCSQDCMHDVPGPSCKLYKIAMEYPHFSLGNASSKGPFSIAMSICRSVDYTFCWCSSPWTGKWDRHCIHFANVQETRWNTTILCEWFYFKLQIPEMKTMHGIKKTTFCQKQISHQWFSH